MSHEQPSHYLDINLSLLFLSEVLTSKSLWQFVLKGKSHALIEDLPLNFTIKMPLLGLK